MIEQRTADPTATLDTERVLVALDASDHSRAALYVAAELAALMRAELHGVFVEDVNLVRLGGIPFCDEVSTFASGPRAIDNGAVRRMFRVMEAKMHRALEQAADRAQVRWSFRVERGGVTTELLAASERATVLSMGCPRKGAARPLGSTTESILQKTSRPVLIPGRQSRGSQPRGQHRMSNAAQEVSTVYTGSEAADRSLQLAARIARRNRSELTVLLWQEGVPRPGAEERLRQHVIHTLDAQSPRVVSLVGQSRAALPRAMQQGAQRVFVMPDEFVSLLCDMDSPVLVVR